MAAVITAVATLAALDVGTGDRGSSSAGSSPQTGSQANPRPGDEGCFGRYFSGIPPNRIRPVETGTDDFDVIDADQPKAGAIGLKFTENGDAIGAMRIAFHPSNLLFKIESIVDGRCNRVEDYSNVTRGGDRNVLQNWDTVRFSLARSSYDLRIGASTTIRLGVQRYVP